MPDMPENAKRPPHTCATSLESSTLLGVKTILVTGATSGIGLESAVALARQGHRLVLVGRDAAKMSAAVGEVKRRAGLAEAPDSFLCDFSSQAQIRRLAAEVRAKYERLDVLVNNVGLATPRREVTAD